MFDFDGVKSYDEDDVEFQGSTGKPALNIQDVLQNIDLANFDYLSTLPDDIKKTFTPYTVQRWMGSLDDSVQVTFNAKTLEAVFGTWKTTGKTSLNELVQEFNANEQKCTSVSKYAHTQYDWRIKFAVNSKSAGLELVELIKEFVPTAKPEFITLVSTEVAQDNIQMLNELVNVNFWELNKHPELVYKLLCLVSVVTDTSVKQRTWIPFSKSNKSSDSEIFKIFKKSISDVGSSQFNIQEYKILLQNTSKDEFEKMLKDMGYQDNDRKSLLKKYKTEQEKYVK